MKVEFNGHFTKEELLDKLDTLLDKLLYAVNKSSSSPLKIDSPILDFHLVNEKGVKQDILDSNGNSLVAHITAETDNYAVINLDVAKANLENTPLKEQDINEWMVVERNGLDCPDYIWNELELVGYLLTPSPTNNYPRVFSVEQFCKNHDIKVVSKRYSNEYVDIKEAEKLLGGQAKHLACAKLYLAEDKIVELFDIVDIAALLGINYTPYKNISYPVITEEQMLGIPRDLYEHESLGKTYCTVTDPYPHWEFTCIFNIEEILSNNQLNLFTSEEIQNKRYTELLRQTDLQVFPKKLEIKNNIEMIGYELSSPHNYFKPIYNLDDFLKRTLPLISEEELAKYPIASVQCLRKLKTNSKKLGINFEDTEIIGTTKDNLLVFNNNMPDAFKEIIETCVSPIN